MAEGVLLTADAAQRMANATRRVEKMGVDVPAAGWYPYTPDDAGGIKLCKTTAAWKVATSQDLDEYAGTPGAEKTDAAWPKVTAWNHIANLPTGIWVLVGTVNGHGYLLSFSLIQVTGYSATKQQLLGHSATGDLAWLDTTACP